MQASGLSSVLIDQSNSESYAHNSKTAQKPSKIPSITVNVERMQPMMLNLASEVTINPTEQDNELAIPDEDPEVYA